MSHDEAPMHDSSSHQNPLAAAFDNALRQVERARSSGMRTSAGGPAAERLAQLGAELAAQRDAAQQRGTVDPAWIRDVIRSVAEWAPESDITLLMSLGAIARHRPASAD